MKYFYKVFSFFLKELYGVYRQPLLLLSLVGGPALVLALFGASFRSPNPMLRTVLVWPAQGIPGLDRAMVEKLIERNMTLVGVVSDQEAALQMMADGQVDVVQSIPADIFDAASGKPAPKIVIYSETIDPNVDVWLRSLTYANTTFINNRILLQRAARSQDEARQVLDELQNVRDLLAQLDPDISSGRRDQALQAINTLQMILPVPLAFLPDDAEAGEMTPQVQALRREVTGLQHDLNEVEQILQSGRVDQEMERVRMVGHKAGMLKETIDAFAGLAPEQIIFPVRADFKNLRGKAYSMVVFYVPGVLALLIQHLGIALGALGIVREQAAGAFELFYVAPVNALQLLAGKTLAYTLYVLVAAGLLLALMPMVGVPMLAPLPQVLLMAGLLALASIGVGMLISAFSGSDTQAIQLTMIVLLFSIFFTGFFMPLGGFTWLARPVSAVIPMTHGMIGMQSLMLLGRPPEAELWLRLAGIAAAAYALAWWGVRRKFRTRAD